MTSDERIASLEQNFLAMKEGIERVEKTLEKLDGTVGALVEKLDARYPSKETVDLRFKEVCDEVKRLNERINHLQKEVDNIKKWQYKVMGAVALAAFVIGIASYHFWR